MVFRLTLAALNCCRATKESCNLFELTEYRLSSIPSVSLLKDRRKKIFKKQSIETESEEWKTKSKDRTRIKLQIRNVDEREEGK